MGPDRGVLENDVFLVVGMYQNSIPKHEMPVISEVGPNKIHLELSSVVFQASGPNFDWLVGSIGEPNSVNV